MGCGNLALKQKALHWKESYLYKFSLSPQGDGGSILSSLIVRNLIKSQRTTIQKPITQIRGSPVDTTLSHGRLVFRIRVEK